MTNLTILDPTEAAIILRVSPDLVAKLCRSRKLRATKVGRVWRILPEALQEYLGASHAKLPGETQGDPSNSDQPSGQAAREGDPGNEGGGGTRRGAA